MKEEIKNLISTVGQSANIIIEPAKQRMANPIIGSFVITFIALNWKPIVFLFFSSKTIEEKLDFFKNEFYGNKWLGFNDYWMYLIFPLILTLIYVVLIPIAIEWIDKKLQYTKVNRLRRENIINYKKHRGQESIAWAQFKTEEARTGFEDRNKLTKDLDKYKNELKEEKDKFQKLTESNLKNVEQITILGNNSKELEIQRDSFKKESENFSKAIKANEKKIDDLNSIIIDKNKSIEILNNQIQGYTNEIVEKNQIINDNNISIGSLNNLNVNYESQISHLNNENGRITSENQQLNNSINQIDSENKHLSNIYQNTLNENQSLHVRLNQYLELENNFSYVNQMLIEIQDKAEIINKQDFHTIAGMGDFVGKMINLIKELNELDLYRMRQRINYSFSAVRNSNFSPEAFINEIYTFSQNWGLTITRINMLQDNSFEIQMYSNYELPVIDFSSNVEYLVSSIKLHRIIN